MPKFFIFFFATVTNFEYFMEICEEFANLNRSTVLKSMIFAWLFYGNHITTFLLIRLENINYCLMIFTNFFKYCYNSSNECNSCNFYLFKKLFLLQQDFWSLNWRRERINRGKKGLISDLNYFLPKFLLGLRIKKTKMHFFSVKKSV